MAEYDWVLTYDIASDRARAKVSKRLAGVGYRVLYSTFTLRGRPEDAQGLLDELAAHASPDDSLLLLRRCGRCRQARLGTGPEDDRLTMEVW